MDLQYEPCNDDGSPIVPKLGARPKWSIPEDNPFLQKLLDATGRKYFKDRDEKAQWKVVKAGLVSGLISAAWYENCLLFALKKQEQKKPISLGSLLKYIANAEKMVDWQTRSGLVPTTVQTAVPLSDAKPKEANPQPWNSPYDQS